MNIAEFAIRNKTIIWVLTVLIAVGGILAYVTLGRLEDPEFTIKDALVLTPYPGASAAEVEEEVTNEIEMAAQQLGQLKRVTSQSERGLSTVTVTIKDKYGKAALPQVWDELRRRINDAQGNLPPGAGPSLVYDDYGDVFGVFLAVTGDGYSYEEIRRYVDVLHRELLLMRDVKKVQLYGLRPEAVYVDVSRQKARALRIAPEQIVSQLRRRNLVADGGRVEVGSEYVPIRVTGEYTSVEQIGELLVSGAGTDRLVRLRDVATIRRGYVEPAREKLRFDGARAIGLGISTVPGGNVVRMGQAVEQRLAELEPQRPVGMVINPIAYQSAAVTEAISGFVTNLVGAVAIVIVVLLIFMGPRSGLIIGSVLLVTIAGTLAIMRGFDIALERISLGALIIALGMLVDNAIVVTDGMLVRIRAGADRLTAARDVVGQNMMPLLGATLIAVIAFAAIGLSRDSTGEYCRSLFWVLMISLMFSWVTAVTLTPLLCCTFLKGPPPGGARAARAAKAEPYGGRIFRAYRRFLTLCIRFRPVTMCVTLVLLALAVVGFGRIESSFFPPSTRAQFMIDVWLPRDIHIDDTEAVVERIEKHVMGLDHVTHVASCIGAGALL
ncbi:MAG: efflux RND transporter permease subunit, partial [Planctomycetota bacterium]